MAPPFGTRALADQQNLNAKPKSTKQFELQVDPSQYLIPELVPGLHVDDVRNSDEEEEEEEDPEVIDHTRFGPEVPMMTRRRVEFDAALEAQEAERAERKAHKYKPTKKEELRYESDDSDGDDVLDCEALGPIHIENLRPLEREMYGNSAIRHFKDYNGQRARRFANVKLEYLSRIPPPWPRNNTPLDRAHYFCFQLDLDPLYELMECRNLILCVHSNLKLLGKDRFSILFKDALRPAVVMMQHIEREHIRNFKQNFDNKFLYVISWLNNQDLQSLRCRRQENFQMLYRITQDLTAKCSAFLECYDLGLDPSCTRPETYWRCLVHMLDLGLLSYIGRHVDPIDEQYLGVPKETFAIPGPFALPAPGESQTTGTAFPLESVSDEIARCNEKFQALNPISKFPPVAQVPLPAKIPIVAHELITLRRHPVAYLEEYLGEGNLWIFHLTSSPLPYAPLYLSSDVNALTNTWGSRWSGLHAARFGLGKIVAWFPNTRKPVVLDVEGIEDEEKIEAERLAGEREKKRIELEKKREEEGQKRRQEEGRKKQQEEAKEQVEIEEETGEGWTTVKKKKPAMAKQEPFIPFKATSAPLNTPAGPAKTKPNGKTRAIIRNLAKNQQSTPPASQSIPPEPSMSTSRATSISRTSTSSAVPESSRATTPLAAPNSPEPTQTSHPPIFAKAPKKPKKSKAAINKNLQASKPKPSPIKVAPFPLLTPPSSDSAPSPKTTTTITSHHFSRPSSSSPTTTSENQNQTHGPESGPIPSPTTSETEPPTSPLPPNLPISLPLARSIGFASFGSRPCISDFQIAPIPPNTSTRSECPSLGTSPGGSREGSPDRGMWDDGEGKDDGIGREEEGTAGRWKMVGRKGD
ncbi:MAG: hypothetical protein MMC33_005255 [Icmadophila ericetorum]|nr:hypothetical protein [Icmadophila ericetorum]